MTDPSIEPISARIARLRKRLDDLDWHDFAWGPAEYAEASRLRREVAHLEADRRAGVEFIPKF